MSEFGFQKVIEEIKRELGEIFQYETRDPRLKSITVMDVKVTPDLGYATVYVSPMKSDQEDEEISKLLKKKAGFFRSELAKRLTIKHTPELRFEIDIVEDHAHRIEKILSNERDSSIEL
jgi:ribosome-binding factor A